MNNSLIWEKVSNHEILACIDIFFNSNTDFPQLLKSEKHAVFAGMVQ